MSWVWMISGWVPGRSSAVGSIRASGSGDALRAALLDAGWWEKDAPVDGGATLCAPLDPGDVERYRRAVAEHDGPPGISFEEFRDRLSRGLWCVEIGKEWVVASRVGTDLPHSNAPFSMERQEFEDRVRFPWRELVGPMDGQLAVVAVDFPNNEHPPEERPPGRFAGMNLEEEIRAVRRELAALKKRQDQKTIRNLGAWCFASPKWTPAWPSMRSRGCRADGAPARDRQRC